MLVSLISAVVLGQFKTCSKLLGLYFVEINCYNCVHSRGLIQSLLAVYTECVFIARTDKVVNHGVLNLTV